MVLWALIAVVLVRGLGAIFSSPEPETGDGDRAMAASFPDQEVRAFAVRFARAYLEFSPSDVDAHRRAIAGFLADGLSDRAAVTLPRRSPGARVAWAMVAREASLGDSRALITVAVMLEDGRDRYLSVPVARDRAGGLAVYELPSFGAAPPRGLIAASEPAPLSGPDAGAIGDLAERFIERYVAGADSSALRYFLVPGTRIVAMPAGLDVVSVDGVGQPTADAGGALRTVLVSARVRDEATGAVYASRYRLEVERRDRWYVRAVAGGPRS